MDGLVEITSDLFNISGRLKCVNRAYKLFYNKIAARYEVHVLSLRPTLQFVIPYSRLDCRALRHALRTRVERADKLVNEIRDYNETRERSAVDSLMNEARCKSLSYVNYLCNNGKETLAYDEL